MNRHDSLKTISFYETNGIRVKISWDLVAVDLDSNNSWTFARRISPCLEKFDSHFTRLMFDNHMGVMNGGYYQFLEKDQVPPEFFKRDWLALTTFDDISARVPVAPECFYRFEPPSEPQTPSPTPEATPGPSDQAMPQSLDRSGPLDQATPQLMDWLDSLGYGPKRLTKKYKTKYKKPRGIEYVSTDDESAGPATLAPQAFLGIALKWLTTAPRVVVLKYSFLAPQFTYYIGVESNQNTVNPPDAVLHWGPDNSIKITHVAISQPPLGGLYEWVKKANAQPETGWLTDPFNPHYHLLNNKVTFQCLFAAHQLILTPGHQNICKIGRHSI